MSFSVLYRDKYCLLSSMVKMTDKKILTLKISGSSSCNERTAVDEQHLKQTVLDHFGNDKGQPVLTQVNKYLIGSTLPIMVSIHGI